MFLVIVISEAVFVVVTDGPVEPVCSFQYDCGNDNDHDLVSNLDHPLDLAIRDQDRGPSRTLIFNLAKLVYRDNSLVGREVEGAGLGVSEPACHAIGE